jgi:uncharacterized protein YcfJ
MAKFLENQMETNQISKRIHPLMAVAAVSVVLVSLLGAAAITGILPSSRAGVGDTPRVAVQSGPVDPVRASAQRNTEHNSVVHHHPDRQVETSQQVAVAPAQPQAAPAAKNSPVGIGIGAVVGGLLGNQVGSGDGKTLATIAGAVGGGYIGNEIAKKNR